MLEQLTIHAYDWNHKDDENSTTIRCWALSKESEPYLLRIENFPVSCRIEPPKGLNWSTQQVTDFENAVIKKVGKDDFLGASLSDRIKIYYYSVARPVITLFFTNVNAMRKFIAFTKEGIYVKDRGNLKIKIWEAEISPIRKLLSERNLKYSQWFTCKGTKVDPILKISDIENEFIIERSSITPLERSWTTKPGILAFDIECYSDNHKAMPVGCHAKHVAYMISCIYQKYKRPETRKRFGILIGECNEIPTDKLDNCEIIRIPRGENQEFEMISEMAKIVKQTDPEIITGYNIMAFDYPYLNDRLRIRDRQWPQMGRIPEEPSKFSSFEWKSGAYGKQMISNLDMQGRISIDLLPIIRRDYKLPKYDLGSVCTEFIGKTKHDVRAIEMFQIYERLTLSYKNRELDPLRYEKAKAEMTIVMAYCIQDSELVIELMEKINIWEGLAEMSSIMGVTIVELFTRGQQIRCLSQVYDIAYKKGYILNKRDVGGERYGGGLVFDSIPGVHENIICLDFASLYPSIIMAYNICYTTLIPEEFFDKVSDDKCNIIYVEEEIEEPKDKNKKKKVIFTNVNGDILNCEEEEESKKEEEPKEEVKIEEPKDKPKEVRKFTYKFLKKEVREGLLPILVGSLINERRATRTKMGEINKELKKLQHLNFTKDGLIKILNHEKIDITQFQIDEVVAALLKNDEIYLTNIVEKLENSENERNEQIKDMKLQLTVLEERQKAIKVSTNSFYGFLGVRDGGKLPLIEAARAITAMGRKHITEVMKLIEDKYRGKLIASDTDSIHGSVPLLIKYPSGKIDYLQVEDLVKFKTSNSKQKQFMNIEDKNIMVWSDKGWSKIKYVMKHTTKKKIQRVLTHIGYVAITEDHSLLTKKGNPAKISNLRVGNNLLHVDFPIITHETRITEDEAWGWGFFMAEGTCGAYDGGKNTWSISNQDVGLLMRCQTIFRKVEPNYDFIIDPCRKSSSVDKLNIRCKISGFGLKEIALKYDALFYTKRDANIHQHIATDLGQRFKKVPQEILSAPWDIKQAFLDGWYLGDGAKNEPRFDIKGSIGAAGLFYVCSTLGYKVSINFRDSKDEIYRINFCNKYGKDPDQIKKIEPFRMVKNSNGKIIKDLDSNKYEDVYDIETENHHFSAGIGKMVVHNSVMMDLNVKDPKDCDLWGRILAEEINGVRPGECNYLGEVLPEGKKGVFPPPLSVEFEKAMKMICFKKKKYAYLQIKKDGTYIKDLITTPTGEKIEKNHIFTKGIVLARRDNCKFLRDVYMKILNIILDEKPLTDALIVLIDSISDLLEDKIHYKDLVIICALGSDYKSENAKMNLFSQQLIAAGKLVKAGDRLDFVVIKHPDDKPNKAALLGYKMLLLEQYIENEQKDEIDYNYYITKVLQNPINQLISVGYASTIPKLNKLNFTPERKKKEQSFLTPVDFIYYWMQNGRDLIELKEQILKTYNVKRRFMLVKN